MDDNVPRECYTRPSILTKEKQRKFHFPAIEPSHGITLRKWREDVQKSFVVFAQLFSLKKSNKNIFHDDRVRGKKKFPRRCPSRLSITVFAEINAPGA